MSYFIHSTVRSPHTRDLRRQVAGPASSTKNLFIGGLIRVVRGRPAPITESFLRAHLAELLDKENKGLLEVRDYQSRRIDLRTLAPTGDAETPSEEVLAGAPEEVAPVPPTTGELPPVPPEEDSVTKVEVPHPELSKTPDSPSVDKQRHSGGFKKGK